MLIKEPRVQPPSLDNYPDVPLYNTKAVVHQTGVPAPTLRAWERRYGILSPHRGENDYRLYSERDIATVAWLRQRVESGMTISQAIALLHSLEPARQRRRHAHGQPGRPAAPPFAGYTSQPAAPPTAERLDFTTLSAVLLRHFVQLNDAAANRTIAQALAVYQVEDVCLALLAPLLTQIGEMWAAGEVTTAVEHFASAVIRAQLESLFRSSATSNDGPLALVGCAPGELHELGALMLALFLRRTGLRVAYLGQNLETDGLLATISAMRPAVVLLSATLPIHRGSLCDVGRRLQQAGNKHLAFIFGGQLFTHDPELARDMPGEFLNMDTNEAAREVRRRLTA